MNDLHCLVETGRVSASMTYIVWLRLGEFQHEGLTLSG